MTVQTQSGFNVADVVFAVAVIADAEGTALLERHLRSNFLPGNGAAGHDKK